MSDKITVFHCVDCGRFFESVKAYAGHRGRMHSGRKDTPLKEIEHGTPAGYRMHLKRGVAACPSCKMAWRLFQRRFRQTHGS